MPGKTTEIRVSVSAPVHDLLDLVLQLGGLVLADALVLLELLGGLEGVAADVPEGDLKCGDVEVE